MSTTFEDFRKNLEVIKDTLRELSEEERQKYRSELDDENSINLFGKIIEEIVEEEKGNQSDWKTKLKKPCNDEEKGGNITKKAINTPKKKIGTLQAILPMLAAEIKKMLKKNKGIATRKEKMVDLTTLITLAAALSSRNDKKSLEDLAKILALSLRLIVDLRRKNLFEFFNMSVTRMNKFLGPKISSATQKLRR
uniref:Uncharacterized protein n=1 Tax=Strongyloides venezuelensis TaxID=75913 RepID=A0A0K0FHH1_STRVS